VVANVQNEYKKTSSVTLGNLNYVETKENWADIKNLRSAINAN